MVVVFCHQVRLGVIINVNGRTLSFLYLLIGPQCTTRNNYWSAIIVSTVIVLGHYDSWLLHMYTIAVQCCT